MEKDVKGYLRLEKCKVLYQKINPYLDNIINLTNVNFTYDFCKIIAIKF